MDARGCRLLVCLLVILSCVFVGLPAAVLADVPDEPRPTGYDELKHEIELRDDGSATWTVEYRYRLDTGADEADNDTGWAELRADVESREDAYLERFEQSWMETVAEAENETERSMELSGFELEMHESSTPPEYGTLRFTFEWESFSQVEVNRIDAGDALVGFDLDERTQLVVIWPSSYDLRDNQTAVEPAPDDARETAVIWNGGETSFLEGEPRIELIEGDPSPDEPTRSVPSAWLAAFGVAAVAIVGAVGWWAVRTIGSEEPPSSASQEVPPPDDGTDGPPRELLSNEEQVLRLLEERGGRVKQQEVVGELGWTEAKTSQVVSSLREDDAVDVFRIGRENVLTLPEGDE
ncbi:DUF7343 domain-containing protein [Natronobeatus ordinarius]|uniref:DUF7343 domain-containing protein n=1 Tax=Natronobeatus ordinarius TaxID=2963433 RepID=UPI0020CE9CB9|nr:hypothetical protein [Natronobeatus ordinarius]